MQVIPFPKKKRNFLKKSTDEKKSFFEKGSFLIFLMLIILTAALFGNIVSKTKENQLLSYENEALRKVLFRVFNTEEIQQVYTYQITDLTNKSMSYFCQKTEAKECGINLYDCLGESDYYCLKNVMVQKKKESFLKDKVN